MRAYIIRRGLLVIPTLFILSILVFLSVRFLPGDAIDAMLVRAGYIGGVGVDRAALEHMLGLACPSTCSTDAGSAISCCAARWASRCGAARP